MKKLLTAFTVGLLAASTAAMSASPAAVAARARLEFRIDEGRNINAFVREGEVAAHLILRSGTSPRILVAFPAGNSGVGLWFAPTDVAVTWEIIGSPRPITRTDQKGRALHGLESELRSNAKSLTIKQALLSSVRVLRTYQADGTAPAEVSATPTLSGQLLSWSRDRLDGAAGYRLAIEALDGATISPSEIASDGKHRLRLKIQALTGEKPLTPLSHAQLFTRLAQRDTRARNALEFLSYREKFLAGSWRFNTYFGRDTLISLMLLMPALEPEAVESGIGSVLARLAPNGEVAHEEDIGEFAVLRNDHEGRGRRDTPIYDYGMIDDDFMLAPLAANWLVSNASGRVRAGQFLAGSNAGGTRNGDALVRNLVWVTERTARFAAQPAVANLVGIKDRRLTGQWRDSDEGLGGGRYPYDVNAVFVPAALTSIDTLLASGLLDSYLSAAQRQTLTRAAAQARVWSTKAAPLFIAMLPADRVRPALADYVSRIGVDATEALVALPPGPVSFNALSLDASGQPIPVLHSDDSFALLLRMPDPVALERAIATITRPFPAGLLTPVGMLVANPVFADEATQQRFSSSHYHGTVVWAWQQAVLAAGLDRQLARTDLPEPLRQRLQTARSQLWSAIANARAVRTSELWSWSYRNRQYQIEPFGQRGSDVDESNAAQLWSTVFLALTPPQ